MNCCEDCFALAHPRWKLFGDVYVFFLYQIQFEGTTTDPFVNGVWSVYHGLK